MGTLYMIVFYFVFWIYFLGTEAHNKLKCYTCHEGKHKTLITKCSQYVPKVCKETELPNRTMATEPTTITTLETRSATGGAATGTPSTLTTGPVTLTTSTTPAPGKKRSYRSVLLPMDLRMSYRELNKYPFHWVCIDYKATDKSHTIHVKDCEKEYIVNGKAMEVCSSIKNNLEVQKKLHPEDKRFKDLEINHCSTCATELCNAGGSIKPVVFIPLLLLLLSVFIFCLLN